MAVLPVRHKAQGARLKAQGKIVSDFEVVRRDLRPLSSVLCLLIKTGPSHTST
ncbi:MAG: hypothetical protein OES18_20745 [Deltaproteobacteria bacterium]|nr:hypothetical protein [Deltaproteobacteria bacterium]